MYKQLTIVNKHTEKILFWSTALSSIGFFLVVILSIASRFIFKTPILGSIELSRLFFVWACMLSAGLAYKKNAHIAITFLVDKMSDRIQNIIEIILNIISLAFFIMLTYYSISVIISFRFLNMPMTGLSQSWFYIPIPLVSLFMALYTIESSFKNLKPKAC